MDIICSFPPAAAAPPAARRGAARRLWRRAHLVLGLTAGLVLALAGLTGSVLVFYRGLDAQLHREVLASPGALPASYEAVHAALRQAHPTRTGPWRIEIPEAGGAVSARYMRTAEAAARGFAPLIAWVDPVRLEVVRSEVWGSFAMTWIYDLHYRLCMGEAGALVMGGLGIGMLVLLGSGIRLWWPSRGHLRAALTLKRGASSQRRVFDLHNLPGLYGLPVLFGLTLTGVVLSLPDQVRPVLASLSALHAAPVLRSAPAEGRARLPLDAALATAAARFPDAAPRWIETPAGETGVYRITLHQPGEPSPRFPRTTVWLDQYGGEVLGLRDGLRESAGDVVLNWMHPLHAGEAGGMAGRMVVLLAGLLPPALFVTGLLRWAQKRRAQRRRPIHAQAE